MSIKIDFISDIHLDFWVRELAPGNKLNKLINIFITNTLKPLDGDVLVIAGDLGHYYHQDTELLRQLKTFYKEIIIVMGNHDLYLVSSGQQKKYNKNSFNRIVEMKEFCKEHNIHYLDGDTITINNVRIGGVGMWYNLPTQGHIAQWNKVMNDSNLIMEGTSPYKMLLDYYHYEKISAFDTQKHYLNEVQKLKNLKCDVLVTHVPPVLIPNELKGRYVDDRNNIFYESDNFENVFKTEAKLIISGHVHDVYDYKISNIIRHVINPLGYKQEDKGTSIKQITL